MKYRVDFVTNSSSSSYLLVYNKPTDMIKDLQGFVKYYNVEEDLDDLQRACGKVMFSIFSHKIPYSDGLKEVRRFAKDACWMKFAIDWDRAKYPMQMDWVKSDEYKALCKQYVEKQVSDFEKNVSRNAFISSIRFPDNDTDTYVLGNDLRKLLKGVYCYSFGD